MPGQDFPPLIWERARSSGGSSELLDSDWLTLELSALHFRTLEPALVSRGFAGKPIDLMSLLLVSHEMIVIMNTILLKKMDVFVGFCNQLYSTVRWICTTSYTFQYSGFYTVG